MLWITELNSVLLFYFFALNEGYWEVMPTDTEFCSWLQKCLKKLLNTSNFLIDPLGKKTQCPWVLPWLRNFLGYVLIFAMFWFRFILLYHQVPFYGVRTPHRQGLNSVILLGWEAGQKSPPTAAVRFSLLILPQNMRNRFPLIDKLCSSLLCCALRRGGRHCTWNKSSFTAQPLSQEQWHL